MSQDDLAKKLDVSKNYISLVENDKKDPSISFLKNTAKLLNIPLVLLIWEKMDLPEGKTEEEKEIREQIDKMVDNAHKRLADWEAAGSKGDRTQVLIDSAKEVGPAIFASFPFPAVLGTIRSIFDENQFLIVQHVENENARFFLLRLRNRAAWFRWRGGRCHQRQQVFQRCQQIRRGGGCSSFGRRLCFGWRHGCRGRVCRRGHQRRHRLFQRNHGCVRRAC